MLLPLRQSGFIAIIAALLLTAGVAAVGTSPVLAADIRPGTVTAPEVALLQIAEPVTPADPVRPVTDESIYFVMTDRFANGDQTNDEGGAQGDRLTTGFDPADKAFHHGGDLAGLRDRLDYIEGLGVSAIWLTPPFTNDYVQLSGDSASSSYHGYWQVDYTRIDPHYGTNEEMRAFVDDAHARGIKVLFDVVLNHTGDVITYAEGETSYRNKTEFPYRDAAGNEFDDRAVEGSGSFPELDAATSFPYTPEIPPGEESVKAPDWLNDPIYYHNRGDSTFTGENSLYGDFFGLDDLFHEHPVVVDGMIDIHRDMIDTFDIDGFRVDTAKHVSDGFWEAWVPAVVDHAASVGKDDFVLFGEVFGETVEFRARYSTELEFPGTLDFDFNGAVRRYAAASGPADGLATFFESDDNYTDADSNAHHLAKFIGNHDEGRLGRQLRSDNQGADDAELVARMTLAQTLNFTTRGRPVVYYGDEQGFVGDGGDQDARQDMFPSQVDSYNDDDLIGTSASTADDNFDTDHPIYRAVSELGRLRADHPALQVGAQVTRHATDSAGIFAFSRILAPGQAGADGGLEYVVAVNNADADRQVELPTDTPTAGWEAVWPTDAPSLTSGADGGLTVDVPALGAVVYRADGPLSRPEATAVTITGPAADDTVAGRTEISADVDGDDFAQVTFAVAVDGGDPVVLGVDDNAPYRVYHDVADLAVGTGLTYHVVTVDAAGNTAADEIAATVGEVIDPPTGSRTVGHAIVHYQRADGDYGDHNTGDFNDFWGLHLWGDAIAPDEATEWPAPKPFLGEDDYGRFAWIELAEEPSGPVNFIVHRGDAKDGTDADRSFDPTVSPEIWLKQDDGGFYSSQAAAQGFVTIRYHRPDGEYGDPTSDDFKDFWGLHLWGDAIAPDEATEWPAPKPFDGVDDYGVFWNVAVDDVDQPVNFIIHRGDAKDPGPDQSMVPTDGATVWLQSGDETIHRSRGGAEGYTTLHYHRPDGDYGDPTSDDFNDFWGLHVWTGAAEPNPSWDRPVLPTGRDLFGPYWRIPLIDGADQLAYILHRGDEKDPGPDQLLEPARSGHEVWQLQGADPESPYIIPVPLVGDGPPPSGGGGLSEQRAHWVDATTIVWPGAEPDRTHRLCGAAGGGLELTADGIGGGSCVDLADGGAYSNDIEGRRHLGGSPTLVVADGDAETAAGFLTGQVAVVAIDEDSVTNGDGRRVDATALQLPGVLDDLYATDEDLGVVWSGRTPTLRLWAPTATSVTLRLFDDPRGGEATEVAMTRTGGVWSAAGDRSWKGRYYDYAVEVYVPSTGAVETNLVTDPYSISLARNSARSHIVDLDDPKLAPPKWNRPKRADKDQSGLEGDAIYELHVRDFSIRDETVPADDRGTFAAFTNTRSNGMRHLAALARAGIAYVHLLPSYDIASVDEDPASRQEPDRAALEAMPPDGDGQQAAVSAVRDLDGFNWGYDPWHYTVPEGSYATDPDGTTRIVEFREMVAALHDVGLGVVMDVVYNHTFASGQDEKSVLDRIVPGYYHRLDETGVVATSTCCANTATEHAMMGRLMVDSVVTWARHYKVDGFRFDLMGHHSKANMAEVRQALDRLTKQRDGIDGSRIILYGEGWNFGEVADDARFVQATQANMAGTGIATFSDRLRDAVRGGGPFDGGESLVANQGFINGLWYDTNGGLGEVTARDRLLLAGDQIRVGLAGNLADYEFVDRTGATVTGKDVDYNGQPAGYTAGPEENLVYIAAHDNQTLFDIGQYHHPLATSMADRVRAQNVGNAIVALAQGIPFYHAGQEMLRSKSMDRDSFNSGDWFNALDFTYSTNNWGIGLPVEEVNLDNWPLIGPRLADPALAPTADDIRFSAAVTVEWLRIRGSSPLFRLDTAEQVQSLVSFENTGRDQTPGVIVMSIADQVGRDLDPRSSGFMVIINPTKDTFTHTDRSLEGRRYELHPVLARSVDDVVREADFDPSSATFSVPARTVAVFGLDLAKGGRGPGR